MTAVEQTLADWDFDTLVANWHRHLLDPNKPQAEKRLSAIEEEWQYREIDIDLDADCPWEPADTPGQGLLNVLGYHIGISHSQPEKLRHKILLRVATAQLPIVLSQSYMSGWGRPESRKRKTKIIATISRFIEEKSAYSFYDRAVKNWTKDLCMIERHYHLIGLSKT